jgi:hypothetical protein
MSQNNFSMAVLRKVEKIRMDLEIASEGSERVTKKVRITRRVIHRVIEIRWEGFKGTWERMKKSATVTLRLISMALGIIKILGLLNGIFNSCKLFVSFIYRNNYENWWFFGKKRVSVSAKVKFAIC